MWISPGTEMLEKVLDEQNKLEDVHSWPKSTENGIQIVRELVIFRFFHS